MDVPAAIGGIIVALFGFGAAIAGGVLQARSAQSFEKSRFRRQAKWDLYTSYFVALGQLSFSEPASVEHKAALADMAQIRARIALVGTADVIESVGRVFGFEDLRSEPAQLAMARALRSMRRDIGEVNCLIDERHLQTLMFGSALETFASTSDDEAEQAKSISEL